MSTCLDCRRFSAETIRAGVRSAPYNCGKHRVIVSPGAKACASFDPKVRKPKPEPRLFGEAE